MARITPKQGWHYCHFLDNSDFYTEPVCYAVYSDGKLVYIGQSVNARLRFRRYAIRRIGFGLFDTPWGTLPNLRVKVRYARKFGEQAMVELRLIRRLSPIFNKIQYRRAFVYGQTNPK